MPITSFYSVQGGICEEGLVSPGSCWSPLWCFWFRVDEGLLSWFNKIFVPAVSHILKTGPLVLFVDGPHSHITLDLIQRCTSLLSATQLHTYFATIGCGYFVAPWNLNGRRSCRSIGCKPKLLKLKNETLLSYWPNSGREHSHLIMCKQDFKVQDCIHLFHSAIHDEKLSPSLPLLPPPEDHPEDSTTSQRPAQKAQSTNSTVQTIPVTPLKVYLRDHFAAVLQRS